MSYIISIDQGTTGSTVLVLNEAMDVVGRASQEFEQIYPKPGWVEHDPDKIWSSVLLALEQALAQANIPTNQIAGIGITNQRETTLLWERATLIPVHNAIVWQDRRSTDLCTMLKQNGHEDLIRDRTGLVVDPYFSGTKLQWLFQRHPDLRRRASSGELAFGTVDSYLVAKLSAGNVHITDVTNASRTLLCAIDSLDWDEQLTRLLEIPDEILPTIKSSSEIYGETHGVSGLPDGIPIAGIAGDQQAALFGQACFSPGDAKCTYGTGAFLLMNTGNRPVRSQTGLLTTCGWQLSDEDACYALEGSAFIAGAAVQWLRDGLGLIASAHEIEALAMQTNSSDGVVFVPALTGLGAPHWRPNARGVLTGLTRGTKAAHIARATLEAIALQNYDILRAMENDANQSLNSLRVDGGASANNLLMQIQADVLGVEISRPQIVETTALGAAFLAGLSTGVWPNQNAIADSWKQAQQFTPQGQTDVVEALVRQWNQAIAKA